jgi:hypothetical protein
VSGKHSRVARVGPGAENLDRRVHSAFFKARGSAAA